MKLGLLVEVEESLDWEHWRSTLSAAERLGFESVWLSDHLRSPWSDRHGLETWTALAVAAAETRRVVLGPLVSPVTFREPAIVARMAESLAALSGGRFVVGLGLGWNVDEHAEAKIAFPGVAERAERLAATAARIRCTRVPVLIGGSGRRATLPIVARYADQWNMTTASVADFRRASSHLDALCAAAGRSAAEILRSVAAGVLVGHDDADLRARAERMRRCIPPLAAAEDALTAARDMGWLVGTVEAVVARLREFAAAGAERAILGYYDLDDLATLELLAPVIRELT
jgi:alkanesulfonate monooxygenase SsuD/methylene tetrahydromethanopterin reductase-like flavin-dependent oxidoreductase (luciferase family)